MELAQYCRSIVPTRAEPSFCRRLTLGLCRGQPILNYVNRSLSYARIVQGERNGACSVLPSRSLSYAKIQLFHRTEKTFGIFFLFRCVSFSSMAVNPYRRGTSAAGQVPSVTSCRSITLLTMAETVPSGYGCDHATVSSAFEGLIQYLSQVHPVSFSSPFSTYRHIADITSKL